MKAKKNKITGISFVRQTDDVQKKPDHLIILHLDGKIPAIGYGPDEIKQLLDVYNNPYSHYC